MALILWIAGSAFVMIGVRVGWIPTALAAIELNKPSTDLRDPLVYALALDQLLIALMLVLIGAVFLAAGCIVWKLGQSKGDGANS